MSGVEVGVAVAAAVVLSAGVCAAAVWAAVAWVRRRHDDRRGAGDHGGRLV